MEPMRALINTDPLCLTRILVVLSASIGRAVDPDGLKKFRLRTVSWA
jgi:hypothetical protein